MSVEIRSVPCRVVLEYDTVDLDPKDPSDSLELEKGFTVKTKPKEVFHGYQIGVETEDFVTYGYVYNPQTERIVRWDSRHILIDPKEIERIVKLDNQ